MAVPNPTELVPLSRLDYQTTRSIVYVDWTDLIEASNFRYRFDGCRAFGVEFDPAFTRPNTTTDSSYAVADASGNQDLDEIVSGCQARRPLEDAGTTLYQWELEVYGQYFDVEASLYREDDSGRVNILTISTSDSSGSWLWSSATGTTTPDQISEGANATTGDSEVLTWDLQARSSDSSNGASVLQIRTSASRITASSFYPSDFET